MTSLLFKWMLKSGVPWWLLFYRQATSKHLTKIDILLYFFKAYESLGVTAIISVCQTLVSRSGFIIPWKFCNLLNQWPSPGYSPTPISLSITHFNKELGKMLGSMPPNLHQKYPYFLNKQMPITGQKSHTAQQSHPVFVAKQRCQGRISGWALGWAAYLPTFAKTITARKR